MKLEYTVPKALAGITVRAFLERQGFSVHLWRKLKHHGTTFINGEAVIAALSTLKENDRLTCEIPEESSVLPIKGELDILYEDEGLLFVNKPAGILVHPLASGKEATLLNYVAFYFQETNQQLIPHPVHRLDRNTTGIVMIAKLPHVQHMLTQNGAPKFHRKYLAIVHGSLEPPAGTINAPISRKPGSIIERCVADKGKPSATNYTTIASWENFSLIEAQPITGRTHQIRVHMSYAGVPLLGDDLYGGSRELFHRQALHAYKMELVHPILHEAICISAPLPPDFAEVLPLEILQEVNSIL